MPNIGRHSFVKAMWLQGHFLNHDGEHFSHVHSSFFLFFFNCSLKTYESQKRWFQDCVEHLEYSHPSFVISWVGNPDFNDLFLKTQAPSSIPPQVSGGFSTRRTSCTLLLKREDDFKITDELVPCVFFSNAHPLAIRLLQKPKECGVPWGILWTISGVCKLFIIQSVHTQTAWRVDGVVDEPCIWDEFNSPVLVRV